MSSDSRRERIESLFNEVVSINIAERSAFLDGACAGDPGLRAEVESMLARHEGMTEDFLESPAGDADVLSAAHAGERAQIGPYRVMETLGEGGFGVVYLAEQTEPVKRRVALKVIKPGMDSRAVLARFEAERQALAMMDHPAIAKVFDAGVSDNGRPYFAMERVKGSPITEFCDKHKLGLKERINLFMQVCEAIQHAHQKGVIHRDIKPSNILVEYEDEKPSPKVIDFGVAKALHQKLTEKTIFTEQGQLIGTPEYMSPEQAEMSAEDIDTRSDIYSMGVLLYELLSGRLPFESGELRSAGFAEIQRIIREVDPPKPSTRLSTMLSKADDSEAASRIASARSVNPADLPRRLRGDLDWIVMKCLEKERSRRYATANAISEELKRYLGDEPVLAGPPSVGYRMSKFVRRNRAGVIAASLVLVVLTAGLIGTTYGLLTANSARELAQQRADELQVITDFQKEMLSGVDPQQMGLSIVQRLRDDARASAEAAGASEDEIEALIAGFDAVTARANPTNAAVQALDEQILSRAIETIDEQFADQPLTDASLRRTIGIVYYDIGLFDRGEVQMRRAYETRRDLLGEDHPETLRAFANTAIFEFAGGRYEEAVAITERVLEKERAIHGEDHLDTLKSAHNLGAQYRDMGRLEEAEGILRPTMEAFERTVGTDHLEALRCMANLAVVLRDRGKHGEAEQCFQEALTRMRRALGADHDLTMITTMDLAILYQDVGRYDEAREAYEAVVESHRRSLGDRHHTTLAAMVRLASIYREMERFSEAEEILDAVLEVRRQTLGESHREIAIVLNELANTYLQQGRFAEAEGFYLRAIDAFSSVLGARNLNVGLGLMNLSVLYEQLGETAKSEKCFADGLEILRDALGDSHPDILHYERRSVDILLATGRFEEAEALQLDLLDKATNTLGPDHLLTFILTDDLALLYAMNGREEQAEPIWLDALDIARRAFGDGSEQALRALENLSTLYQNTGRYDEGSPYTLEWRAAMIERASAGIASAESLNNLAMSFLTVMPENLRDPAQALRFAGEACEMTEHAEPAYLDTLAMAQFMSGDADAALQTQRRAVSLLPPDLPADHPMRIALEESLAKYEAALEETEAQPVGAEQ